MVALVASLTARADEPQVTIVDHIMMDSVNVIVMPDEIMKMIQPYEEVKPEKKPTQEKRRRDGSVPGFRVQIFSDNNQRTAMSESKSRQRAVSKRFPAYRAYSFFNRGFWRTQVGDFTSQAEANACAAKIRSAFPSFSGEVRVVKANVLP